MFCPFKMANPELATHWQPTLTSYTDTDWVCEREQCELWNERFGKCALAVDAHLKGQEDIRAERGVKD